MKINEPVTDREVKLRDGQELVTRTDLRGTITYANPAFVEISGFSSQELLGKNHNVVRHPDMPPAAFKDLWETLKLGRPWTKLVKNRCKNGDYYWVKANVTPVFSGGEIVEYMSVRTRPSEQEIREATELYAQLRQGEASLPAPEKVRTNTLNLQMAKTAAVAVAVAVLADLALTLMGWSGGSLMIGPILAFLILLAGIFTCVNKQIIKPLDHLKRQMKAIAEGQYNVEMDLDKPGEIGEIDRSLKILAVNMGFQVNDAKIRAASALQIKVALDSVTSNVMMADNNGEIIYC